MSSSENDSTMLVGLVSKRKSSRPASLHLDGGVDGGGVVCLLDLILNMV